MKVDGKDCRAIWLSAEDSAVVEIIDQRSLPHLFVIEQLRSVDQVVTAIGDMHVRGAPLIGAAAGFGIYLAAIEAKRLGASFPFIEEAAEKLRRARPTAINLSWAVDRVCNVLRAELSANERIGLAKAEAELIVEEELRRCQSIGKYGADLLEAIASEKEGEPLQILTHCNAGWLACVDYGTATAPIYELFERGCQIHVWVDETRPRNQGARLTAWEMSQHGVPHTVIADNTGGHLMQQGLVDAVIVGTDRTTRNGDVVNKVGTYLKALAAKDNQVPFYVALPSSTIDWQLSDGSSVEIEERNADEVKYIQGLLDGKLQKVLLTPENSPAANYAFDMTPGRLVTGLITERGVCQASEVALRSLYPEMADE